MFSSKFVVAIFTAFVAFGFTACVTRPNQVVYTPEQNNYGFNVDEGSNLANPPENKARVYAIRRGGAYGFAVFYNMYYQYEPKLNAKNKLIVEKDIFQQNLVGGFSNGARFFMDFDAGKPLLLIAGAESLSYIVFTPKSGKIYCVEGQPKMGWWLARFNIKFIDKRRCQKIWSK